MSEWLPVTIKKKRASICIDALFFYTINLFYRRPALGPPTAKTADILLF